MSEWFYKVLPTPDLIDNREVYRAKFAYQPYWRGSDEPLNVRARAHARCAWLARQWDRKPDSVNDGVLVQFCNDEGKPYSNEVFMVPNLKRNDGLEWSGNDRPVAARIVKVGGKRTLRWEVGNGTPIAA